jgi:hypothetical protein
MKYVVIPFLVITVVFTFLYLYISPVESDVNSSVNLNLNVESMGSILPYGDERLERIKQDMKLISQIKEGIKNDRIACIVPRKEELEKSKKNVKIVFPESAAFGGGDVVMGSESMIRQKNPLLEIVKEKEISIHKMLNSIQLDLDIKGDKFKSRFLKKSILLKDEIDDMKKSVVSGCARQKLRLKNTHPHLSNYEFVSENTNTASITPSNYIHGKSLTPVVYENSQDKKYVGDKAGLVQEFYSI